MRYQWIDSPRTVSLSELLGNVRLYHVWGLIEGLIHFAAKHAPQGALGEFSNSQIAKGLDYPPEDADLLIQSLISTGILESHNCCTAHRIMIASWKENMPDMTRKYLRRQHIDVALACGVKKRTKSVKRPASVRTTSAAKADNGRIVSNRIESNGMELDVIESNRIEQAAAEPPPDGPAATAAVCEATTGDARRGGSVEFEKTATAGEGELVLLVAELHEALGLKTPAEVAGIQNPEFQEQFKRDMKQLRDVIAPVILADGRKLLAMREARASSGADVPMAAFIARLRNQAFGLPSRGNGARYPAGGFVGGRR